MAKIGSYEYDPVTGISIWSSEMFNLVGRDPALGPMSVPEFMQLMHPEDRTAMQSMLEGCARDGVSGAIEFRGDPASGEIRYFIGNVQAASDSKGRITKLFGTIQDITERKQAEEALIASEIRYRRLFESAKDGILILNAETGQIVDVNPFLFNLIGFSFEELMGRKLWEIGLFKDIAASKEAFKELQDKGYVRYEDLPLETKDGKKRDVEFVSNVYQVSNMRVVQCNVRDITERKRAQDTIKESEERFATAFRNSPILMAISTLKDGRFIETNDAFCRAMGYRHEELLGHSSLELNLWYDPGERMATLEKMKGREELSNLEVRFRTKSGETRTAEMSMVKIILRNEPCLLIIAMDITERKLLEEELEREYEENKLIIDSSPVLIFYKDREGRFLRVNNAFAVALDMPEDKFLGRTVFDLYSADIAQSMTNDDNEVFESGISKLSIIEQYESARGIRWVQTDKVPILDKSGKTIGLVGFAQDITERKQAEEAIRESEEKFNKAFHASPNLMAVITLDEGRIIDVNEAYSTITGYKREELWGNVALELNLWANPEQRKDFYQKINKDGRLDNMEILLRTKAGEIRAFLFSAEKITLRGIPCLVTVALDITERKLAEERINHLNLTLQSVRNVNQLITREKDRDKLLKGVCDTLVKGRSFFTAWIVLLNESKEVITHAASGIRGDFTPLLSRIKQEETLPCIQKALKKSGVVITENPHTMCADCPAIANSTDFGSMTVRLEYEGAIYGILCSSLPKSILTDKSEAELFQEVATDIAFALHNMEMESEYTRLEQERLRVAKLESIGTLAGGIAHDFNNLLTGIMGNIGLVKTYIAPSDATYEMLNEAENAAARARDLTQQLLTFARGGKPVKKLTSVAGVIKESAEFALRGSKVKLELSLPDNLWPIEADEGQINQVINNLAINADEAMPRGGTLKIRAENLVYKKSAALPLQSGNYVRVDIEDTGIGISPENLQRIFEPYFTTKQRGSGLGLTTAYSIVRNHNGIILADSILNRGSTFRIYLPATKKILKGGKKVTVESAGQAGGKVLVMDDEEIIRKMLKNMLSLAGYTVELAADGDEAITKYQQARAAGDPFNAVIMDLTIPGGMGGKEAVKKLLEIDPKATVIVSSGYATDAIMSEYKKYGFKSVIAKPYSVRQLQDTLSGLLTKKKR
ncbi:MAG: hypothetical protein A2Z15_00700 [Chloroflexi bacterium RBG_16_50_11]|nr:MAG: hypothetical protein A2Z15_00700 [Chloroflexi bacterium RBG_16_50_11]